MHDIRHAPAIERETGQRTTHKRLWRFTVSLGTWKSNTPRHILALVVIGEKGHSVTLPFHFDVLHPNAPCPVP